MSTKVIWRSADEHFPDDDTTVLVALADGEVWTGFRDAGVWRFVSGERIEVDLPAADDLYHLDVCGCDPELHHGPLH